MFRLRAGSANVAFAASVLSLATLAGCAAGANLMPTASTSGGNVQLTALSDSEAEAVIAQAIAQHEMRRP
jgi:hypothetical protein